MRPLCWTMIGFYALMWFIGTTAASPLPADGPILSRYGSNASNGIDAYRPRQFDENIVLRDIQRDAGGVKAGWKITNDSVYDGWDVFAFGGVGGSFTAEVSSAWATFTLDRPATLGYVHRQPGVPPSWITSDGWTLGGTVDGVVWDTVNNVPDPRGWNDPRPVYTKAFPAGVVALKSPSGWPSGGTKILPWILFSEGTGTPSVAPSVPAGQVVPVPNQLCPAWVHAQTKAPNSGWLTWHPPVNSKYWCYYGHDHGSDPALVYGQAGFVRYGEVAAQMSMFENHWGHKNYAVDFTDVDALFVHHFGTTNLGRVNTCAQQFHLLEVHVLNNAHTQTLAVLRFMADYGRSMGTLVGDVGVGPINPDVCPNGNAATGYTGTVPSRQIPIPPFCTASTSYEPWGFIENAYRDVLGLGGNPIFNTTDPLTCPSDVNGNTAIEMMTRSGTGRFFTPNNFAITCPAHANAQGYWWTDAMAHTVVTSTTPGAVRQFCKPGWTGVAVGGAGTPEAAHRGGKDMPRWGGWAIPVPGGEPGDFEGSIMNSHGPN